MSLTAYLANIVKPEFHLHRSASHHTFQKSKVAFVLFVDHIRIPYFTESKRRGKSRGEKVQQTEHAESDDMVLDKNNEEEEAAEPTKKQKKTVAAKTLVVKTPAVKPLRLAARGRKPAKKVS